MQACFQAFKPFSKVSQFFSRKAQPNASERSPDEQPNPFEHLPDDLVTQIAIRALPSDVYEGLPTLLAMNATDKKMSRSVQPRLQRLKAMQQCWRITTNPLALFESHLLKKRLFMPLHWLSPIDRQEVLDKFLRKPDTAVLDGLGPQLSFFKPKQREKLLQKILHIWPAHQRADAICKLATNGMSSLTSGQRGQLLNSALNFGEEKDKAEALKGFGAGLAYLSPEQRQTLINGTLNIQDPGWRGMVIGQLGAGLKHLDPDQRQLLVESTLNNPTDVGQANVLRHWGPEALSELTPEQRGSLVNLAFKLRDPANKERAFQGLAKSFALFTPEQQDRLIHEPLGTLLYFESGKPVPEAESINPEIWGEQLSHMTSMQRERLVNTTLNLRSPVNKIHAIGAFVRGGLNYLTCEQRQALVNTVLAFSDRWYQVKGIRKLAIGGLKHLAPDQRAALVQAAVTLPDPDDRAKAVNGIARGGLQYLTEDQRATLVTTTLDLPYSANQVKGINGLGRGGLEHLDPEQRAMLVLKTWATPHDHLAKAISGLGAGWKDLTPRQRAWLLAMTRQIDSSVPKVEAIQGIIGGILKADEHWLGKPSR